MNVLRGCEVVAMATSVMMRSCHVGEWVWGGRGLGSGLGIGMGVEQGEGR